MQRLLIISCLTLIMLSCGVVDTQETLKKEIAEGTPYVTYNGIVSEDGNSQASFTMVNDSTETIQYFAYSATAPHYSTEVLSDTGWVYLLWNWCGTGADYISLEPGSSFDFVTQLPYEDCSWRVLISVANLDYSNSYILRSEAIEYSAP